MRLSSQRSVALVMAVAVFLSGCLAPEPDRSSAMDDTERAAEVGSQNEPTHGKADGSGHTNDTSWVDFVRQEWKFTHDFMGDTIALGFELNETTRLEYWQDVHYATWGAEDTRNLLAAVVLYEPSRGPLNVISMAVGAHVVTNYYYRLETPIGTFEDEDYNTFVESKKVGASQINMTIPPGDWTLILMFPGAKESLIDQVLRFDRPVEVYDPVYGPLGFNFDERALRGGNAVITGQVGVQQGRSCTVHAEYTHIGRIYTMSLGPQLLTITGPSGDVERYVSTDYSGYYNIDTLERFWEYRLYQPGVWIFDLEFVASAFIGYSFNIMGVDIPLPNEGHSGYHVYTPRDHPCV